MTYDSLLYGSNVRYLQGWNGGAYSLTYRHGFAMRFVKDAPPASSVQFYDNDQQTGTPTSSRNKAQPFNGGTFASTISFGSVVITGAPATIYLYQYQEAGFTKGYFGSQTSSNQPGGGLKVWSTPLRPNNNIEYEIKWTSGNQGGVWDNNPTFADRKQEGILLPVGTWYLTIQYYGIATNGGTIWNTGVYG